MNKKGFTLIELLAVIVILAVISLIAVPLILSAIGTSKAKTYALNETTFSDTVWRYLAVNDSVLPTDVSNSSVVLLTTLISNNYIKPISDPSGGTCDGYSVVTKTDTSYTVTPYIKCGSNYETIGYKTEMLTASKILNIEYLIVAGGGGGGYRHGGGGGAGGLLYNSSFAVAENTLYSIIVGNGGIGGQSESIRAALGENSSIGNIVAYGGGGAGQGIAGFEKALTGGSGGGSTTLFNAPGIAGQGNQGGKMAVAYHHGGGGGAGGPGIDGISTSNGNGGPGLYFGNKFSDLYGQNGWFAGGGGAGSHDTNVALVQGLGGIGGGGNGAITGTFSLSGGNAMDNTGGGGGGAGTTFSGSGKGGNGGSGVVLIRYQGTPKATGGTITSYNGYTVHAFTTIGTSVFQLSSF